MSNSSNASDSSNYLLPSGFEGSVEGHLLAQKMKWEIGVKRVRPTLSEEQKLANEKKKEENLRKLELIEALIGFTSFKTSK